MPDPSANTSHATCHLSRTLPGPRLVLQPDRSATLPCYALSIPFPIRPRAAGYARTFSDPTAFSGMGSTSVVTSLAFSSAATLSIAEFSDAILLARSCRAVARV